LIAAGYQVYAVNPLQAARYRERFSVSGAKSDPADGHLLGDMVRTDHHQLRVVAGDTDLAEAVKVVTRAHKTLISVPPHPSKINSLSLDKFRHGMSVVRSRWVAAARRVTGGHALRYLLQ
jgi:hypothetical protein